jgi:hypothetical protein
MIYIRPDEPSVARTLPCSGEAGAGLFPSSSAAIVAIPPVQIVEALPIVRLDQTPFVTVSVRENRDG